ncbi:L,D-transpeptidase YcbB [Gammaproteobacteria bacterium]
MMLINFFLFSFLMMLTGPTLAIEPVTSQQWIQDHVAGYEEPFTLTIGGKVLRVCHAVTIFYQGRNYSLAWSDADTPLPRAHHLVRALKLASREGLDPAHYQIERVEKALAAVVQPKTPPQHDLNAATKPSQPTADPVALAELDVLLSQTFLRYASHLGGWRADQPSSVDPEWSVTRPFMDPPALLAKAVASDKIEETLFELLPHHLDYARLREFLERYRAMAAKSWPRVAEGPKLSLGSRGPRVVALRARLAAEGFLSANRNDSLFDEALSQGVRNFQKIHGLEPDGVVSASTLEILNTPVEAWIRQIEINLERWRWLPRNLGRRHIMVNVAGYDLEAVDNDRTVMTMKVVVGKPYLRTPVFSAEMSYLVLNPYWNVPPTIAGKEILPELRKNPGYLASHDMEVNPGIGPRYEINPAGINWSRVSANNFPYRLRQRPGPKNPLGTIKFMLPNQFNVYLHDTSQRKLFARTERVFSHGCIRVEKPAELMEYVLGPKSRWNRETLKNIDRQKERIIGVPQPIPVHILYWTAWVDNDGKIQFRKDVYGRDKLLEASRVAPASSSISTDKFVNHLGAKI